MIGESDTVVLVRDFKKHGLIEGDTGTVAHIYNGGGAYEVEFATGAGETLVVLTLTSKDVRPLHPGDILHARQFGVV